MKMITAELVEDETKQDAKGRRITAAKRREEVLRAYDQSGLTQSAFARREGIKYHTFIGWLCERRSRASVAGASGAGERVKFSEVSLPITTERPISGKAGKPNGVRAPVFEF